MIFGLTYYEIALYFVVYSFLGWCTEVVFHAVRFHIIVNRGFLNGPVCPVYGFGMITILALLGILPAGSEQSYLSLFFLGFVFCSLIELIAGWLLDVCFHTRWWDYSHVPFNLHGYICLPFSIIWGVGVVLVVRLLHPLTHSFVHLPLYNTTAGWCILALIYTIYLTDFILTASALIGLNKKLKEIDVASDRMRMLSDSLSIALGDAGLTAVSHAENAQVKKEILKETIVDTTKDNLQAMQEELAATRKEVRERTEAIKLAVAEKKQYYMIRRLMNAFPNMEDHVHPEFFKELRSRLTKRR